VAAVASAAGVVAPGVTRRESVELRRRNKLLEQEMRCCAGPRRICRRRICRERLYPLVSELAGDGVPVAVTCRVLNIARQPYYRWLARPVTAAEAYRAGRCSTRTVTTLSSATGFLADEADAVGQPMADRTAWRIYSGNGWWSAFGRKRRRGKGGKVGPPVHDDLVRRDLTATGPDRLWLADITGHHTGQGKLYLCAVRDLWSNRIVGYCIDTVMKSRLAVTALDNAARRRGLAGCLVHTDRGSRFRSRKFVRALARHDMVGSAPPATTPPWNRSSACSRTTSSTAAPGPPATISGSRSSPGSNGPTTVAAGNEPWPG
jgi:putative transposase